MVQEGQDVHPARHPTQADLLRITLMLGFLRRLFRSARSARRKGAPVKNTGGGLWHVEEHFDQLVAGVKDHAIFLLDPHGRILTWNAGAEQINGYSAAEILGEHFSRFYTEAALDRGWPQCELDIARATGKFEENGWRVRKDGSRFWANVTITALYDPQGDLRGFLKITRDLTLTKQTEEALRQSEERFRLMIKGVKDYAIFMLDPEGNVTTWNEGAQKIKGYEAREIIGKHFSCFYPEEVRARGWPEEELRLARIKGVFEDEGWRLRKDGTKFWANVVITAIFDEAQALLGFSKITRDLTERMEVEEKLKASWKDLEQRVQERTRELTAANEALQAEIEERKRGERDRARLEEELRSRVVELAEADRQKNDFLAMLGHELRNPLAPIRNALHILKMPGADASTASRARDTIERPLLHLVRLVDDLLDVSRIMRGKVQLRREAVELISVLGQAVEMSRPAIDAHGHELIVSAPEDRILIEGDEVRLAQAVNNLLLNAAKYTENPGRIWLTAERRDGGVAIHVKDTGIGIPADLLPHVFEIFVQGDHSLARSRGGLGVGLTLVKRLVEMQGGKVRARSEGSGKGSHFTVWLPVQPGRPEERRDTQPAVQRSLPPRRILVVDDNVDAAETAASLLKLWGHEVKVVHDGVAVLEAVREFQPQFILLDIGLPGMTGFEVARQIRSEPEFDSLVIAAMTGYGQAEDVQRSREAGFNYHLTKPLDPLRLEELFSSVH
jgi:PAS domain S-box-containing protein